MVSNIIVQVYRHGKIAALTVNGNNRNETNGFAGPPVKPNNMDAKSTSKNSWQKISSDLMGFCICNRMNPSAVTNVNTPTIMCVKVLLNENCNHCWLTKITISEKTITIQRTKQIKKKL